MAKQHVSMRGEIIDFNRLRIANAEKVALGNAPMNARGDILGEKGTVLKTQEQIETEWAMKVAEQKDLVKTVSIKDDTVITASEPAVVETPKKQLDVDDADFVPEVAVEPAPTTASKSRRKIVESD